MRITDNIRERVEQYVGKQNGLLRLKPAWVARDFIPPGRRFGLPEKMYELGDRGGICERWLASTTRADNRISVPDEGLSTIEIDETCTVTLKEVVELFPELIMGKQYAATHTGLGRLAKIFDYADRIPYHIHQMQHHARLVGRNSKDEAYYFPEGVDTGKHAETFFGVHPYITREKKYDRLLPHLVDWKDDSILEHAFAYQQRAGDGFHIPSGVTHGPGTALTIELQEDSDVFAMLQAKVGDIMISKELLFKDVRNEDRERYGERIILEMIDWETSGDPDFYRNRHTPPRLIESSVRGKCREYWIFYNSTKFSGKMVTVWPGETYEMKDAGVYSLLVWRGAGLIGGVEVEAGNFDTDELLVIHDRAVDGVRVTNSGTDELEIFTFFGPDIRHNVPMISRT
jgi:hypothetical protein